jgi:predicted RNase H-like nuclease (RuvC/YqgF family)
MKKYIVMSFLFLLLVSPVSAKAVLQGQKNQSETVVSPTQKPVLSPTGHEVQNRNQIQVKNQGESTQVAVQNKEKEQLEEEIDKNMNRVATQVQELIETVGAKGGIGTQVREIAQEQQKLQQRIKEQYTSLSSRSNFAKLMIGADEEAIKELQQRLMENEQIINKLEKTKTATRVRADLEKIEETIDLMKYQNASLQSKIQLEQKYKGMFGWLLKLFR